MEVLNSAVIGDREPLEAVFSAENALDHPGITVNGLPPNVIVTYHHVEGMGLLKAHLERTEESVKSRDFIDKTGTRVAAAFGCTVDSEMLERGSDMLRVDLSVHHVSLICFDLGESEPTVEVWVFSHSLFGTSPSGITGDVNDRSQYLLASLCPYFACDHGIDICEKVLVP